MSQPRAVAIAVLTSVILALGLLGIATTVAQAGSYEYDRDSAGGVSLSMIPVTFDEPSTVWISATSMVRALHGALPRFGVAAKGGKTLYRAVGPEELADIQKVGGYRVKSGMAEGKYFFDTPEQASNFARMMGKQPYTTTSVRVSGSNLAKGQRINPAKEGPGYFFDTSDVPWGTVRVWDRSVLP